MSVYSGPKRLMENDFEILIESFIKDNIGISEHFLSDALSAHLAENLLVLYDNELLLPAATGNKDKVLYDTDIRTDSIYWLDREHNDVHENAFFDRVDEFIIYLNETCYAGITGCEFHYSLYEVGSFYKKHLDQFKNDSNRQYSLINYLNASWQPQDGGELLIHQSETTQSIAPNNGKTVFFKSNQLVHEVLTTHKRRMSITGWLKRG
jgi:Rps23 Pro-64 3,4-dihydroxylase Tpa1-like proline 4-hydroxylase